MLAGEGASRVKTFALAPGPSCGYKVGSNPVEWRVPPLSARSRAGRRAEPTPVPDPLQAVVFDMDGLLLDTETMFREVARAVCSELGFEMLDDIHLSMIGLPAERGEAVLRERFGTSFPLDRYRTGCRTLFRDRCRVEVPVKSGAQDILERLETLGIPTAVATSTARAPALDHLRRAGLLGLFRTVVTRDDVSRGKPDPDPFLLAASRLGVDPRHCLALEDSHNGIRAAHAAGMHVVMVPDLLPPTDEIAGLCAAVMPDLHAVREAVERALGRLA